MKDGEKTYSTSQIAGIVGLLLEKEIIYLRSSAYLPLWLSCSSIDIG